MSQNFLVVVLDTSSFAHPNLDHLLPLIRNFTLQINGVEVHVPYAVKNELRFYAGYHENVPRQDQALNARRWLADNHDALVKQTWLQNSPAETLFPGQARDQVLHYATRQLDDTVKYRECWIVTEDRLFQLAARANGLQAYSRADFVGRIKSLFPVKFLNTKWIAAAMENRMAQEILAERRKRARYVLVVEERVLLKRKMLEKFLKLLEKDRRADFMAGVQVDVPKIVLDRLSDVQRDIGCRYRKPEELVNRAINLIQKYGPGRKDSQVIFHCQTLEGFIEGKALPGGADLAGDYNEGLVRYCRQLVATMGETHVVALVTDDGGKRKLMRTEQFQVVTLWPA